VALAGVGVGLAVWAAHQAHYDSYYYYVSDGIAAVAIAAAVLYGSSAVVGFLKTKKCRAATQEIEERLGQASKDNLVVPLYAGGLRTPPPDCCAVGGGIIAIQNGGGRILAHRLGWRWSTAG
jgi:hypothetical protein